MKNLTRNPNPKGNQVSEKLNKKELNYNTIFKGMHRKSSFRDLG
jgi:hypothetical protein